MLGWIPLIEPMFGLVGLWYWLVIPLVIGISMVYKAIRIPEDGPWGREVIIMTAQVLVGLVMDTRLVSRAYSRTRTRAVST